MDPSTYVTRLRSLMQTLQATAPRCCSRSHTHISNSLTEASPVFVRHNAVRKPLQQPYDGPYRVLQCSQNFFQVIIMASKAVSIYRLKPAHLDHRSFSTSSPRTSDPSPSNAPLAPSANPGITPEIPAKTTQSGHRVH